MPFTSSIISDSYTLTIFPSSLVYGLFSSAYRNHYSLILFHKVPIRFSLTQIFHHTNKHFKHSTRFILYYKTITYILYIIIYYKISYILQDYHLNRILSYFFYISSSFASVCHHHNTVLRLICELSCDY